MRLSQAYSCDRARGFTLLELLLVTVLLLALTSAMVFNFSNLLRGNQLEEGTTRLETLMRFARAQAANSGRKVQLVFDNTNAPAASTGEVRATWEPDPLGQPGWFAELCDAQWHVQEVNDLVQVESVKLLDTSHACLPAPLESEETILAENDDPVLARSFSPITFYPDGSSDSAEIILAARSPDLEQRMAVRLIGLTGSISHQRLAASFDDGTVSEAEPLSRSMQGGFETLDRDGEPFEDSTPRPLSTLPPARSSQPASNDLRAPVGETNNVENSE